MNITQKLLINKLCMELVWWKQGEASHETIEEFVRHEVNGLTYDQESQVLNALNKLFHVLKQVE